VPSGSSPDRSSVTLVVGRFDGMTQYGLTALLRKNRRLRVLASGLERAALERAIVEHGPQVAIFDEEVEHALLARLHLGAPATSVLVFARHLPRLLGTSLLEVGATSLARDAPPGDVLAAIHRAARGEPTFFGAVGNQMGRRGPVALENLTPAEIKVFEHASLGKAYAEIGAVLHIHPETARTHIQSICTKVGAKNKRDLIGMPLPRKVSPASG
jgi:DNA-binding NarL/FixJ family response regulator